MNIKSTNTNNTREIPELEIHLLKSIIGWLSDADLFDPVTFTKLINYVVNRNILTREFLATEFEYNKSTVFRWEKGEGVPPKKHARKAIIDMIITVLNNQLNLNEKKCKLTLVK